jgi:hypothetical protein
MLALVDSVLAQNSIHSGLIGHFCDLILKRNIRINFKMLTLFYVTIATLLTGAKNERHLQSVDFCGRIPKVFIIGY